MNPDFIIAILLGYLLIRELVFHFSTQRLINKLMSRNYGEYQLAEAYGKKRNEPPRIKIPNDDIEDFGSLSNIG